MRQRYGIVFQLGAAQVGQDADDKRQLFLYLAPTVSAS